MDQHARVQGIDEKSADKDTVARDLSRKLGNVTIMQKGPTDIISNGEEVLKCDEQGGLKRCGGQGDILSGQIGTMLAWAKLYEEGVGRFVLLALRSSSDLVVMRTNRDNEPIKTERLPVLATYGAAVLTRTASRATFERVGRAMQTSDMLNEGAPHLLGLDSVCVFNVVSQWGKRTNRRLGMLQSCERNGIPVALRALHSASTRRIGKLSAFGLADESAPT